jgi:hypothetical protein
MFVVFDLVVGRTGAVLSSPITAAVLVTLWLVVPWVGGEVNDSEDNERSAP